MKKKIALLTITVLIVAMFASCGVKPAKLQDEGGWTSEVTYMIGNEPTNIKIIFTDDQNYVLKRITGVTGTELCITTGTYKLEKSSITLNCSTESYFYNKNSFMWAELPYPLKGQSAVFQANIHSAFPNMILTLTDDENNEYSFFHIM